RVPHPQLFDHSSGRAGRDELLPAPHEPPSPDEGRVRDRSGTRHAQRPDPGGDGAHGGRRDSLQVGQAENPASGRGPRRGPDPRLGPVQVHEQGHHDRIVPARTDPLTSDIRTFGSFLEPERDAHSGSGFEIWNVYARSTNSLRTSPSSPGARSSLWGIAMWLDTMAKEDGSSRMISSGMRSTRRTPRNGLLGNKQASSFRRS